jgi:hypothetical protein
MIVAVIAVGMVQMPIYEIVDVVAVGHRLVSTARSVNVIGVMSLASVTRSTSGWIGIADL